ncbi:MAG: hypothetical protein AAGG48_21195 [Planctomycetota bacterium]
MNTKALIVDDDLDASEYLRYRLSKELDWMDVDVRQEPDVSGEYGIYFVDNDFHGRRIGTRLVRQIRSSQPESLIFAFSASLDAKTLKQLINAGCDGVCEKQDPGELTQFLSVVRNRLRRQRTSTSRMTYESGLCGTIRSITELLREWNRRLESNRPKRRATSAAVNHYGSG